MRYKHAKKLISAEEGVEKARRLLSKSKSCKTCGHSWGMHLFGHSICQIDECDCKRFER